MQNFHFTFFFYFAMVSVILKFNCQKCVGGKECRITSYCDWLLRSCSAGKEYCVYSGNAPA